MAKELTRNQTDADFFEKAKSPCCGEAMRHNIRLMNNKPYQRWICTKCGEGWNNTTTEEWNYEQQKISGEIGKWAGNLGSPKTDFD